MAKNVKKSSFFSGELSPLVWERTELQPVANGCKYLDNFLILPAGGLTKRPGTRYITSLDTKFSKIISFQASSEDSYIIALGDLQMLIYDKDGTLLSSIASPYTAENIKYIDFCQINDVLYIVNEKYAPYKLTRYSNTNWILEEVLFSYPPSEYNPLGESIAYQSGKLYLQGSNFYANDIGSYFIVEYDQEAANLTGAMTSNLTLGNISVYAESEINMDTTGVWAGSIQIQITYDDGNTWRTIRTYSGNQDRNLNVIVEVSADDISISKSGIVYLRCLYNYSSHGGTVSPVLYFYSQRTTYDVIFKVNSVNLNEAGVSIISSQQPNNNNYTTNMRRGLIGGYRNSYPTTIAFHEQRLVFGGTTAFPQTLYFSQTDDFENFKLGVADTDSISFTIASTDKNTIRWMNNSRGLVIGTDNGEFIVSSEGVFTPTNLQVKRQSNFGSEQRLKAISVKDIIIFFQRGGRKIRELKYDFASDNYTARELTILSEHITDSKIYSAVFSQNKFPILYAVLSNGNIITMTYEADQEVIGFSNINTNGLYKDIAVLKNADIATGHDRIYVLVERVINNNTIRFLEYFDSTTLDNPDDNAYYVDCGVSANNSNTLDLSHLGSIPVKLYGDGDSIDAVSSATTNTIKTYQNLVGGLAYSASIVPVSFDFAVSKLADKNIKPELTLAFHKTQGIDVGYSSSSYFPIRFIENNFNNNPTLFSGHKEIYFKGGYDFDDSDIYIMSNVPTPATILALYAKFTSGDR